jgi:DNA-binding NarL/FixJ family response regulator
MKIKILIVDDHQIVREGLRALLAFDAELEIVGEAENGRVAIELAQNLKPDVVLMDVVMPSLNGVEALRRLRTLAPKTKVIILSSYRELEYVHPALDSGAAGYLLKHSAGGELLRAIREAHAGKTVLSPAIEQSLRQERQARFAIEGRAPQGKVNLSPREWEVLQLIAEGLANKQMAAELGISIKTVEKHRQHLMDKLNLHDTAALTRFAVARGVVGKGPMTPELPPLESVAHHS